MSASEFPLHPGCSRWWTRVSDIFAVTQGFTSVRFGGQENGTNTMGGLNHDYPVDCTFTPNRDRNPGGQAYRPIPVT